MQILLIEDNDDDACLIKEALAESIAGAIEVEWVDCLEAGITRLARGPVDVVLLDLSLSDSRGLETFDKMHATNPAVPVVVLTGFDDEQTGVLAVQRGAQDYLVKKRLDPDRLIRVLRYAIERQRAECQLRQSTEQLRSLTRHMETVREEERTRIARELHDELGQKLTGLKMDVMWLSRRLNTLEVEVSGALLTKTMAMTGLIDDAIVSLRRLVSDLRPGVLDHLGLVPALEWQATEFHRRTGIPCRLAAFQDTIALAPEAETALFRIVQEALTNVVRHAKATQVTISLQKDDTHLQLSVVDDGRGITDVEAAGLTSFGILGLKERVTLLGGLVRVGGQVGRGTAITASFPLTHLERGMA